MGGGGEGSWFLLMTVREYVARGAGAVSEQWFSALAGAGCKRKLVDKQHRLKSFREKSELHLRI